MNDTLSLKRQALAWGTLLRIGPTARGVLPFLLGTTIAWSQGYPLNWAVLLLSSLGVVLIMLVTFLVNEYYDYGADLINRQFHSLSGGSRVLPMGLVSPRQALWAAYVVAVLAAILGLVLYFVYHTGLLTLPLGLIALLVGYFYTAKPVRLSYHGLGEIAIWFACGWLATIMGYYLQTGRLDDVAILASFPGAFSVFLVILINEVPDMVSDEAAGKRNLAVRLGVQRTALLYIALLLVTYAFMIAIIFFGVPVITAYFSLVLLPLIAWNIFTLMKRSRLGDPRALESVSLRTMLFDHLVTFIYIAAFIVVGLTKAAPSHSDLVLIALLCVFVLTLEGVSVACSKAIRGK